MEEMMSSVPLQSCAEEGFVCISCTQGQDNQLLCSLFAAEVMNSAGVLSGECKMQWYHRCQSVLGESGLSLSLPLQDAVTHK